MKFLIISKYGSKITDQNIEKCDDLINSPYIPSFDIVILDLASFLDIYYTNVLYSKDFNPKYKEIVEFLEQGKKLIITNPEKKYSSNKHQQNGYTIEFDKFLNAIFPFDFSIKYINGTHKSVNTEFGFSSLLDNHIGVPKYQIRNYKDSYVYLKDSELTIAASISDQYFVLNIPQLRNRKAFLDFINSIDVLPSKESLDYTKPEWISNYKILDEDVLSNELTENNNSISTLNSRNQEIQIRISELDYIKSVVHTQGTHLEQVVEKILNDIGITVESSKRNNRVDRKIYIDENDKIVCEIKGRLRKSAGEKDCAQLEKWKMEGMEELGYEPKGVLFMCAFAEIRLEDREDCFPNQMLDFAKKKEHSLVETKKLLDLYINFVEGKTTKEEIFSLIRSTIGVLE